MVMRPAGVPFPNCQSWLQPLCISAYLQELCTHRALSSPLLGYRSDVPHSVRLGGPFSAPQLGRTKQLLASSPSCCPRPRNTDAPEIQSCTCSSHAESCARPTCPDYFSSAGERKIYFLVGNFCISCWRSVFVCLLEYPALPTLTGLPSTADCGKPHLHLNTLHYPTLYFLRLYFLTLYFLSLFSS